MSKNSYLMQFYEKKYLSGHNLYAFHCLKQSWDNKNGLSNQRKIASIIASARIILLPTVTIARSIGISGRYLLSWDYTIYLLTCDFQKFKTLSLRIFYFERVQVFEFRSPARSKLFEINIIEHHEKIILWSDT